MASSASLTRFTVPLGGNQSSKIQGLLMPKLQFRFRVFFTKFGVTQPTTELTKQIVSFNRPQVQMEPIEIPVYNSRVYIAGRPQWQAVQCVLRDDAGGNVTTLVGEQLQKQYDFMEQASASSAIDYKFTTIVQMLDGNNGEGVDPGILETWELYGCFLNDVNYNELTYAENNPVTITMSIRYDNALQTSGGSVGQAGITKFNPAFAVTG